MWKVAYLKLSFGTMYFYCYFFSKGVAEDQGVDPDKKSDKNVYFSQRQDMYCLPTGATDGRSAPNIPLTGRLFTELLQLEGALYSNVELTFQFTRHNDKFLILAKEPTEKYRIVIKVRQNF